MRGQSASVSIQMNRNPHTMCGCPKVLRPSFLFIFISNYQQDASNTIGFTSFWILHIYFYKLRNRHDIATPTFQNIYIFISSEEYVNQENIHSILSALVILDGHIQRNQELNKGRPFRQNSQCYGSISHCPFQAHMLDTWSTACVASWQIMKTLGYGA